MAPQMVQTIGIQYKNMSLIIKKNTTFKIPRTGIIQAFLPSSLGGLSLWLKADAGVSKLSFNYVSRIILSGGYGTGTYDASTVPDWDFNNSVIGAYSLGDINYYNNIFTLSVGQYGGANGTIISYDGINWEVEVQYYVPPVISGVTGQYAGANGSYNYNDAAQVIDYFKDATNVLTFYISGNFNNYYLSAYNSDTNTNYPNLATCVNGVWTGNIPETANISGFITRLPDPNNMPTGSITTSTVNTDYVTEWADQSGNSIVLTPDNQNAPTFVSSFLNGKPAIEFIVENNTGLSNTSFSLTGFTFFSVAKQKPTNTGRIFSSYFGNVLIGTWGSYSNRFYGDNQNGWLAEGTQTSTDFLITTAFSDPNTTFDFSQNGISQSSGASNSTVILNGISVGGGIWNGGNEEASDSYVCEIIIYNRTLSLTERQQVEQYLNAKYQIY